MEKREIEKIKREIELESLKRRYTDKLHSVNIKKNDVIFIVFVATFNE